MFHQKIINRHEKIVSKKHIEYTDLKDRYFVKGKIKDSKFSKIKK